MVADGSNTNDSGYAPVFMACMYASSQMFAQTQLPTEMRTFPTLEIVNSSNYYSIYRNGAADLFETLTISKASTRAVEVYNTTAVSGTAGHAGFIRTYNANAKFALKAEL